MKSILASPWFSGVAAALIWIIITLSTGGSVAFALLGGVAVLLVASGISYLFHRYAVSRRNRAA